MFDVLYGWALLLCVVLCHKLQLQERWFKSLIALSKFQGVISVVSPLKNECLSPEPGGLSY